MNKLTSILATCAIATSVMSCKNEATTKSSCIFSGSPVEHTISNAEYSTLSACSNLYRISGIPDTLGYSYSEKGKYYTRSIYEQAPFPAFPILNWAE